MAWIAALIGVAGQLIAQEEAAKNQPPPAAQVVKPQGAQTPPAESVFKTNVPNKKTPTPAGVSMGQNIDPGLQAMTLQPGKVEADIQKGIGAIGTPNTSKSEVPSIGQTLSALGPALAQVAPLIMAQQQQQRPTTVVGAQGGGGGGQVVPGFNLPQMRRPTIGELLQSLPRPRYG